MASVQEQNELTAHGIPVTLRPFFQEYRLDELDPERNAFTVIERTLAWGDAPELKWLFARYGPHRLEQFVRRHGWRALPARRFNFWVRFFDLSEYARGERIWPH